MSKYQIEDINICYSSVFHHEEMNNVNAAKNLYYTNSIFSNNKSYTEYL